MPLSRIQTQAVTALDWLLDERKSRQGMGRTTVLAIAFIRKALRAPLTNVEIFDHYSPKSQKAQSIILRQCERIINCDIDQRGLWSITPQGLYYRGREPRYDWMPSEEVLAQLGGLPQARDFSEVGAKTFWEGLEEG